MIGLPVNYSNELELDWSWWSSGLDKISDNTGREVIKRLIKLLKNNL
jgi:hypothetical protein